MINRALTGLALMALALAAACSSKDNRKSANDIDPAVTNALEDQIMVDPNLVGQANRFGRTPSTGSQAPIPDTAAGGPTVAPGKLMHAPKPGVGKASGAVTLGQMAKEQPGSASCDQQIEYSTRWATMLPDVFPLYPDAQVTEAGGNNVAPCRMRLVSFISKAPLQTLVDFYYTQAVRNGFTAEHQLAEGEHVLAGVRQKDGGAYYLSFNARKDGSTDVDMIVNHGR